MNDYTQEFNRAVTSPIDFSAEPLMVAGILFAVVVILMIIFNKMAK